MVLEGQVRIGGVEMEVGDYLYTSPGEEHDVVTLTGALICISSEKPTPVVE